MKYGHVRRREDIHLWHKALESSPDRRWNKETSRLPEEDVASNIVKDGNLSRGTLKRAKSLGDK
jgi:hypothetical protein